MKNRIFGILTFFCVSVFITSCEKTGNSNTDRMYVTIAEMQFTPDTVRIAAGSAVTWTNNDVTPHTVTNTDGLFKSNTLFPGDTYVHMFIAKGTYTYTCTIHPNMNGTIIVY